MSTTTEVTWHDVAAVAAVSTGEPLGVEVHGRPIGLYEVDGEIYALSDICTHEYAMLSKGFVDAGKVECPLHQACFDIRSGKCYGPMAEHDLRIFPVRVVHDRVLVGV